MRTNKSFQDVVLKYKQRAEIAGKIMSDEELTKKILKKEKKKSQYHPRECANPHLNGVE